MLSWYVLCNSLYSLSYILVNILQKFFYVQFTLNFSLFFRARFVSFLFSPPHNINLLAIMSLDNSNHELGDLGNMKSYEPRVEALHKRDDWDRDGLVRLGKKPVLKVPSRV